MDVDSKDVIERAVEAAERRSKRLNAVVAVTVALLATFMGICKVKDDNIVQAMQQAQADRIDLWSFYQARNLRQEVAEATVVQLELARAGTADKAAYDTAIARFRELAPHRVEGSEPPEYLRNFRCLAKALGQLSGSRVDAADIRSCISLDGDQRHTESEVQPEFLLGAFRGVRQSPQQSQPTACQPDCLPICISADGVLSCLLEVLCGPLEIRPALEVHREFRRDVPGAFAIEPFRMLAYSTMEMHASRC